MSPWLTLALAPTLQPWVLIGPGAATVVEAKLSSWESFLALFLFCVLASSSYLAMEIYAVVRPSHSQALLARFRSWIDAHTDQVIIGGWSGLELIAGIYCGLRLRRDQGATPPPSYHGQRHPASAQRLTAEGYLLAVLIVVTRHAGRRRTGGRRLPGRRSCVRPLWQDAVGS